MALPPAAFAASLLEEARATHPWLHHPLSRMIYDGRLEARGRLALRRAITARRICADGMPEAFVDRQPTREGY